jgi:hypothetical protein
MKLKFLLPVACAVMAASSTFAGVISFENGPLGVDLGTFYQGITFGVNEQIMLGTPSFPAAGNPTTGHVLGDVNPNNASMLFIFSSAQSSFSFLYTSADGFSGVALNSIGTPIATFSGAANSGSSTLESVSIAGIKSVVLTDSNNVGGQITIDSLTASGVNGLPRPVTAPDATSTLGLLGAAGIMMWSLRRKFVTQQ